MGTPTKRIWPDLPSLPYYRNVRFPDIPFDHLGTTLQDFDSETRAIVKAFLVYDPKKRIKAEDALDKRWFDSSPRMCKSSDLPWLDFECRLDPDAEAERCPDK